MAENTDDNDPFEEDINFDQTDLLYGDSRTYNQLNISQRSNIMPRFFLFIRTISLCVGFIGLGLCASLSQGPIIQLEILTGIPTSQALHIFTAYCVGMLIGGIMGSWLFERYNRQFLMCMCFLSIGIFISILPFAVMSFWWTLISLVALGSGLSFMFTGGNVLCLDMWGKKGSAYLVSIHFSFALGALLAPIVIHPLIINSKMSSITNSSDVLKRNSRNVMANHFPSISTGLNMSYVPKLNQSYYQGESLRIPAPKLGLRFGNSHSKSSLTSSLLMTESSQINDMPILPADDELTGPISKLPKPNDWGIRHQRPEGKYLSSSELNHESNMNSAQKSKNTSVTHKLRKSVTVSNWSANNGEFLDFLRSYEDYGITGMHVAYIIVGVFMVLNSIIALIFLCICPREPRSKQIDGNFALLNNNYMTLFTISFAIYMFTTEAVQGSVHHFLASSSLISKNNEGQAMFWGLICSVRFLCIFITGCCQVRPEKILLGCNLVMLLGTILVCVGTFDKYDFLFGGIVVIAIGIAPVLPSCFLWMANIMKVTHKMCAFMIIISSIGNSLTHTSLTLVQSDSHLYAYIMVTISICSIMFLFLSLYIAVKLKSAIQHCFRDCSISHQFDDEEGLSMLVSVQRDTNSDLQHRMAELDESSHALLID